MGADVRRIPAQAPGADTSDGEQLRRAIEDIKRIPLLDGVEVLEELTSGTTKVMHKLGRKPTRLIVTKAPSTLGAFMENITSSSFDVTVSITGTYAFWVY